MRCFYCSQDSVFWINDYSYSDIGMESNGIVLECECKYCGAFYEVYIDLPTKQEQKEKGKKND